MVWLLLHMNHKRISPSTIEKGWTNDRVNGTNHIYIILAVPCGMQDLSSPTRDGTWALGSESKAS